ncbi:MAG: hypothetical protein AAGH83_01305 [Pseudomonadota bacterium]
MKRYLTLFAMLPGAGLAHSGHAPVPDGLHGLVHAAPGLAVLVVACALGAAVATRWRP